MTDKPPPCIGCGKKKQLPVGAKRMTIAEILRLGKKRPQ